MATRNIDLADRIRDCGLTLLEVAEAVSELIEDTTGVESRYDERSVRRLLAGDTRWPRLPVRRALETLFETTAVELGFIPPEGSRRISAGEVASTPDRPLPPTKQEAPVQRRQLFRIAGGAAISIIVPQLPSRGRLGKSDLDRLRIPLQQLFALDDRSGGVTLAREAIWHGRRTLAAIDRYDTSVAVSDALYGLAGEYLAAGGWFAIDANDLDRAGQVLPEALQLATMASDHLLTAQVWNHLAMKARESGTCGEIHQIARTALRSTAARQNPRIAALFHSRAAYGHAYRGERHQARRSMQRAYAALDKAPDTDVPAWLSFVNPAQLCAQEALIHSALGQWPAAVASAQEDLRIIPAQYRRNRVHGLLHLADASLGAREPAAAAAAATTAVHSALDLSGSLSTGRAATRLRKLRHRLNGWRTVPEVAAWIDLYDNAQVKAA